MATIGSFSEEEAEEEIYGWCSSLFTIGFLRFLFLASKEGENKIICFSNYFDVSLSSSTQIDLRASSPQVHLFCLLVFILLGHFLIMNLFVAVIVENVPWLAAKECKYIF